MILTMTFCPRCHLLVRTNIPSKLFEGPSFLVLKVMVILTMTFCPRCHLLVRTNIPSKFKGPSPKHCQVIKLFSTKGPSDFDLCPQDHLLVRTNISTEFEGPNHKHCGIVSFLVLKVTMTLTFDLKVIYSSGPSSLLV